MAFLNFSRPTSGIVALVGASLGVPALGGFVYSEIQKVKSATPRVFECMNEKYQLSRGREVLDFRQANLDTLSVELNRIEPELRTAFHLGDVVGDLYFNYSLKEMDLERDLKSFEKREQNYLTACPSSITEAYITHSAAAPYWFCIASLSLAVAGIGLVINRWE